MDWTKGSNQWIEHYEVSPNSWIDIRKIDNIISATISSDITSETRTSATYEVDGKFDGEKYVRTYLCTNQNGIVYKEPLGTFLLQSFNGGYNGIKSSTKITAYSPLIELKEKYTPICYTFPKDINFIPSLLNNIDNNMRAKVIQNYNKPKLPSLDFVASPDDTWLSFMSSVLNQNKLRYNIDAYGRFYIEDISPYESMPAKWTFNDDVNSILYKDIRINQDLYSVPNVIEVYISTSQGTSTAIARNDNPNSPTSTINRGREIVYRDTNTTFTGIPSNKELEEYAKYKLKSLSTITTEITFSHGYCPIHIGDTIKINYNRSGIIDKKAKVISQSIEAKPGCKIETTASFTTNTLIGGDQ